MVMMTSREAGDLDEKSSCRARAECSMAQRDLCCGLKTGGECRLAFGRAGFVLENMVVLFDMAWTEPAMRKHMGEVWDAVAFHCTVLRETRLAWDVSSPK